MTNLDFFANNLKLASCSVAPFAFDWQPAEAGIYFLTAAATDSQGLCATSAPVVIQVSTPATTPALPVRAAVPRAIHFDTGRDHSRLVSRN